MVPAPTTHLTHIWYPLKKADSVIQEFWRTKGRPKTPNTAPGRQATAEVKKVQLCCQKVGISETLEMSFLEFQSQAGKRQNAGTFACKVVSIVLKFWKAAFALAN